ncbi:hypothetical protein CYMTET_38962 [Cymbomonas tetramitiformis]|uniref:Uncharacterized protein n=1 Tax=Cymbomonas tetramitiformis TaxID=36881 RepID=A0AAE0CB01_9CHLO|nr:hypothetical protein CYMTET_38962 [Cymbomonas tetramitiformis]
MSVIEDAEWSIGNSLDKLKLSDAIKFPPYACKEDEFDVGVQAHQINTADGKFFGWGNNKQATHVSCVEVALNSGDKHAILGKSAKDRKVAYNNIQKQVYIASKLRDREQELETVQSEKSAMKEQYDRQQVELDAQRRALEQQLQACQDEKRKLERELREDHLPLDQLFPSRKHSEREGGRDVAPTAKGKDDSTPAGKSTDDITPDDKAVLDDPKKIITDEQQTKMQIGIKVRKKYKDMWSAAGNMPLSTKARKAAFETFKNNFEKNNPEADRIIRAAAEQEARNWVKKPLES